MARNKEFDTTEVLHKAMKVFGHYGFEGTSLQNLLDGLGIARQSLYDTYGTKRDLFIKAVKHYVDEKSSAAVVYLDRTEPVKKVIAEIFQTIVSALQDDERREECLILYSAIDQIPHDSEIAAIFERDRMLLEKAFYEALVRAQSRGEIGQNQDLHVLARYLYHARYSMTQAAKLSNDPKVLEDVAAVVLSTLDRY
ncbi:TetR/AcrR family transcriptional regulator [Paenibacillus radicis (ex Gao et al. 2016)]|uniref:HTH-type transcriptional regulator YezE n=1 Tax=Paenibacillus radicis (ex Gao et al. 2016) TaxID=1737354 RepID=A0A917LQJ0_9BACL|nr:TetR/AcrR family transcriptional regulator [Paenibacillus radicis (ex Gao et al. 2016)]GGG52031.1 putative HTH-type transcriptional regulator YezE [Paenibacillus radicis (ex Gao et al. 2016)]